MNKRQVGDYRPDSWWVREFGGMPGWAIVGLTVVIAAILCGALIARFA